MAPEDDHGEGEEPGDGIAAGLRKSFIRVALVAFALLYLAVSGLYSAMEQVNGEEIETLVEEIRDINRTGMDSSYVFSAKLDTLPEEDVYKNFPYDHARLDRVETQLELLAKDWFAVPIEFLGTKATVDLRHIAPLLPFAFAFVAAYLWTIHRKVKIVETVRAKQAGKQSWKSSAFQRHPQVLWQVSLLLGAVFLYGFMVYTFASLNNLIARDVQTDYLNLLGSCIGWLIFYVSLATDSMRTRTDSPGWGNRLMKLLGRVREKIVPSTRPRFARGRLLTGGALVLMTLMMFLARSCKDEPHSGFDYVMARGDATWFNSEDDLIGSITDVAMRPLYAAVLIVACFAVLGAIIPWRASATRLLKFGSAMVRFAAVLCRSLLLLAFITIALYCCSTDARVVAEMVCLVAWAWLTIWLWRTRKEPELRARRWELIGLAMLPPLLTFGIQAALYINELALIGVPTLLLGTLVLYSTLRGLATR